MEYAIVAALCIVGTQSSGTVFLARDVGSKNLVDGALDGPVSFSTAVGLPRYLMEFFCIGNHVAAESLIVHIEQGMEEDDDP